MTRPNLVAARAGTFEQPIVRHHSVTATITRIRTLIFFRSGHQLEIAALDAVWTFGSVRGPQGGLDERSPHQNNTP